MATRAEWAERVDRWQKSGLSAEDFAARERIKSRLSGFAPMGWSTLAANVPLPLLTSTLTVLPRKFATAMSGLPPL